MSPADVISKQIGGEPGAGFPPFISEGGIAMDYPVKIVRSRRKTIALSVEEGPSILVKSPVSLGDAAIKRFVGKHRRWIENRILALQERKRNARVYSPDEIAAFRKQARLLALKGFARYAQPMGVAPAGLKITSAATRWGSCSAKNGVCFSWRIALLPPEASDYIIVHELAHIRVKNHGPRFYAEVAKILPDYRARIALLKQSQRELGL